MFHTLTLDWRLKLVVLCVLGVPAFSGYPVNRFVCEMPDGVAAAWLLYGLLVYGIIGWLAGRNFLAAAVGVASLITLPIVFGGALIAYVLALLSPETRLTPALHSSHYISLALTMLTVIPLALAFVAVVPFQKLERNLLRDSVAVTPWRKYVLMFMRVFSHIIYFVTPTLLEVLREEGFFRRKTSGDAPLKSSWCVRFKALLQLLKYLGLEAICASLQYIPLWALEISRLSEAPSHGQNTPGSTEN